MNIKEKVLQKCAELSPLVGDENPPKKGVTNLSINNIDDDLFSISGDQFQLDFDSSTPDDDPVWPLAAQVLGIGEDEKGHNYVKELLRQAFLQGRDTSGMPEKEALANFHRAEKEYYLPRFGNPQNLIDALQKIATDGNERDFDAAEFAEMAIEDWEQNGKILFANKSIEGPTIRQLLEENIRLLKAQQPTESPKPDWVKEEIKEMMQPSRQLLWEAFLKGHNAAVPIRKEFNEWVQALPPDTLKEDRELVKRYLSHEFAMGNGYLTIQTESFTESVALANALKRLCGMEVGG